ncbi:MAG TPA: tetratricopeptide repeat-containing glycosyltransferase family protein [Telmatospirillum sp.]|nr:tetratricopeptide repeat-containing glycosyltransferase family protein [Telmatospirillum sp.]
MAVAEAHDQAGRFDVAERLLVHIIAAMPSHHPALHAAAVLSCKRKRPLEALTRCRRAIELAPDIALYHRNICEIYRNQARLDEAIDHGRRAVALAPDDAAAHYNLGVIHYDRLEIAQAIAAERRAVKLDPAMASAHFELAEALLVSGRFEEGWREYEWRFDLPHAPPLLPPHDKPLWDGRPMPGTTLLLIADQGFGDTIQFCRYIPAVAKLCPDLIVAGSSAMRPIVLQQPDIVGYLDRWEQTPAFDAYCPLSGLPRLFGTDLASVPAPIPYVKADPAKVLSWRRRLDALLPKGYRRIGLVWSGRPTHGNDGNRSMSLARFAALAALPKVALVSLQMGEAQAEIGRYWGHAPLINLGAEIKDFTDSMAILDGLDRLVSVDTGVAHLAGAMGRPVSILLPFAPDWRWLLNRPDSPWYPSVTLCRQTTPGDWDSALSAVIDTLN